MPANVNGGIEGEGSGVGGAQNVEIRRVRRYGSTLCAYMTQNVEWSPGGGGFSTLCA